MPLLELYAYGKNLKVSGDLLIGKIDGFISFEPYRQSPLFMYLQYEITKFEAVPPKEQDERGVIDIEGGLTTMTIHLPDSHEVFERVIDKLIKENRMVSMIQIHQFTHHKKVPIVPVNFKNLNSYLVRVMSNTIPTDHKIDYVIEQCHFPEKLIAQPEESDEPREE